MDLGTTILIVMLVLLVLGFPMMVPLLAGACDLVENMSVLTLLESYPSWCEASPQLALRVGPRATLGKWAALTATLALLARHALLRAD